jgi:hypothetical protein
MIKYKVLPSLTTVNISLYGSLVDELVNKGYLSTSEQYHEEVGPRKGDILIINSNTGVVESYLVPEQGI